jgi:hypothetical protein
MEFLSNKNAYSQYMNPEFNNLIVDNNLSSYNLTVNNKLNASNIIGVSNSNLYACQCTGAAVPAFTATNKSPLFLGDATVTKTGVGVYTFVFNTAIVLTNPPLVFVQVRVITDECIPVTITATGCVINSYIAGVAADTTAAFELLVIGN